MDGLPISTSDLAALNVEITLTIGACLILVWSAFESARKKTGLFAGLALATVVAGLAGALFGLPAQIAAGNSSAFSGQIAVDAYGTFFAVLFLVTAALTIAASGRFLDDENSHHPEYYFFMLMALVGMLLMARATDLISIFVGLELQALSVYVLVGFLRADRRSNEAALKYFILGSLASGVFVYALSLVYAVAGKTSLAAISVALGDPAMASSPILVLALILLVVALAFKVAAVPFHLWAPDAYTGAPTPVALFISVASKAAGFAMLVRILFVAFGTMADSWTPLLAVLSVASMTFGNVAALSQDNIKRMFAYSSIAHAGYALMGVVAGTELGITSTMYYLFAYTFMNIGAWSMIMLLRRQNVAGDQISDFAGLAQRSGWAAGTMLVFLLSLGGIPPTIGFLGKWYVFGAALDAGWTWLAVIGALNAAVAMFYYLRIVVSMFMQQPDSDVTLVRSLPLNVTLAVSAVVTVLGVLWATPFVDWVRNSSLPF